MEDKFEKAVQLCLSSRMETGFISCGLYAIEDFDDYWDELLPSEKAREIECHCLECLSCLKGIAGVKQSRDEAAQIADKIDTGRLLNAARKEMDRIDTEQDLRYQWAASERQGLMGQAFGVVVAVDEGIGAVAECNAFVDEQERSKGKLEIWGRQVEGFDNGFLIGKPLDYLEEKLSKGLFRGCAVLKSFNLDRRNISVDLKERAISHAGSLSLAIIMSIINALYQRNDSSFLYSADLLQDGRLQKVGQIEVKINAALKSGLRHLVLAKDNRKDVPAEYISHPDLEILFFDTLEEILVHFGLQPLYYGGKPIQTQNSAGIGFNKSLWGIDSTDVSELAVLIDKLQIDSNCRDFWNRLISFVDDLCQTGEFQGELSTTLLIGSLDRISRVFPDVFMKFDGTIQVFNAAGIIENLACMVNGRDLCFVLDPDGNIESIRRIDFEDAPVAVSNSLLPANSRKMAEISAATDAVLFYFPPFQNQVQLFSKGAFLAKYANGRWRMTDYEKLSALLMEIAENDQFHWPALCVGVQAVISLSDLGCGGAIAFIPATDAEGISWYDGLAAKFGLHLEKPNRRQMDTNLLMSMARLKGAVILNRYGQLMACNAIFETGPLTGGNRFAGLRHRTAYEFSAATHALVLVASRFGSVTIYYKGEEIIQI